MPNLNALPYELRGAIYAAYFTSIIGDPDSKTKAHQAPLLFTGRQVTEEAIKAALPIIAASIAATQAEYFIVLDERGEIRRRMKDGRIPEDEIQELRRRLMERGLREKRLLARFKKHISAQATLREMAGLTVCEDHD